MRKILGAMAIAIALCLVPTAAFAENQTPSPEATEPGTYTPREPRVPTLVGSTAVGECNGDVPWIGYSVALTDPDNQSTSQFARLRLTDGTNTTIIDLGQLTNGTRSGRVLWPGASVNAQGEPTGWPGWAFENGEWVETDGNFRWTRGNISAYIEVNPTIPVALSYPPSTPVCATDPSNPRPTALPATGLPSVVLPIGIIGGVLAVIGVAFVLVRRRRAGVR